MEISINQTLDCKGLSCPMPMMKLAKAMKELKVGEVLEMLGTDPGTKSDLPKWCEKSGNTMLQEEALDGGVFRFIIKKN
jgi:tRNA 2-thiouridine synthesizing protein A